MCQIGAFTIDVSCRAFLDGCNNRRLSSRGVVEDKREDGAPALESLGPANNVLVHTPI